MTYDEITNQEEFDIWADTEEGQKYLNSTFAYLYFDLDYGSTPLWSEAYYHGVLFECPYWIEEYYNKNPEFVCQYVSGYFEPNNYNDILTIDNKKYRYVDSQSLSEELEIQLNNGTLVYEYRSYSFLRILQKVTIISDLNARKIASDYYNGVGSKLYSFVSTGTISYGVESEIKSLLKTVSDKIQKKRLYALQNYIRYHGECDRQENWQNLNW